MFNPKNEDNKRSFSILPSPDPGFGGNYEGYSKRLINKDGSFNAKRIGVSSILNLYQSLVNMRWYPFFFLLISVYFILNVFFAVSFFSLGEGTLNINYTLGWLDQLLQCYFFSVQTFTTVGYGGILPVTTIAGVLASFEALTGLLFTAMATGLLYGRFSRPKAKIVFSKSALISPYRDGNGLMFRLANARNSQFTEMNVRVIYSKEIKVEAGYKKQYFDLKLERKSIVFFPLSWTVVHPIDNESPFYGLTEKDIRGENDEVLILVTGYDDTFNQTVHSRHSYTFDEIIWGAKFKRNFSTNEFGEIEIHLDQIGDFDQVERSK